MTKELFTRLKKAGFPGSEQWANPKDAKLYLGQFLDCIYPDLEKISKRMGKKHFGFMIDQEGKHSVAKLYDFGFEVRGDGEDVWGWAWLALRDMDDTKDS